MNDSQHILRFCSLLLILCIALSSAILSQEQGKIREFDEGTQSEKKDTILSPQSHSIPSSNDTFGESDGFEFIAEAIGTVLVGALIQFPDENSTVHDDTFWTRGFSEYPYSHPDQGMFSLTSKKTFAFSFSGHYFSDGKHLTGYSGRLFVSPHQSFNLEAQVIDLSEKLTAKTDHLRLYNFFVDYNRIKSEWLALWWGLGLKGMNGPTVNKTGFALNSGFEIFPIAPFSMAMNYNAGFINKNSVQEFTCSAHWYLNRYNLLIGYQYFTVRSAVLDGLILGVTAHF